MEGAVALRTMSLPMLLAAAALTGCAGPAGSPPLSVQTLPAAVVNFRTVIGGGEIVLAGDLKIQSRGICWSVSPNPSFADLCTYGPGSEGTFVDVIRDLPPGVEHHVRAYAVASMGVVFGNDVSFEVGLTDDGAPSTQTNAVNGELILFAGQGVPVGFLPADGRSLTFDDYPLASRCIGGASQRGQAVTLPRLTTAWPPGLDIGQSRTPPGWLIATNGYYCDNIWDAYRGQVVFTRFAPTIWIYYLDDWLPKSFASKTTMGSNLGADVVSLEFVAGEGPALVGEIRLFRQDVDLASSFLVANGAEFPITRYPALAYVIGQQYGGDQRTFRLPNLRAPSGYVWAIAYQGVFPDYQ